MDHVFVNIEANELKFRILQDQVTIQFQLGNEHFSSRRLVAVAMAIWHVLVKVSKTKQLQ